VTSSILGKYGLADLVLNSYDIGLSVYRNAQCHSK
jgi:hypothetical protein